MLAQRHTHRAKPAGFTLIELMVAVAIVGILATIAATSYQRQVMSSRRTDARNALLDLAGRQEKLFSTTNQYSNSLATLGYGTSNQISNGGTPYYTVGILVPDTQGQNGAANTYLITATPIPGTTQANDSTCTTLTVNQLGVQGSTGTGTASTCWGN
jgi:type IV pilus assembly protein PilE